MIDLEDARRIFKYDGATGKITNRITRSANARVGEESGTIDRNGYRVINVAGRLYRAHRLAWFMVTGEWPKNSLDHISGDVSDNRMSNLREATKSENGRNSRSRRGSSQYKGVSWDKLRSKWQAHIMHHRKSIALGRFDSELEAHKAYCVAADRLHGDFARVN